MSTSTPVRPAPPRPGSPGRGVPQRPRRFDELGVDDARRTAVVALGTLLSFAPISIIFTDRRWLIEAIGAVVCVIGPAALLRLRSAPRVWQLSPGIVLLAAYASALYLDKGASAGFIPNSHAWVDIQAIQRAASHDVQNNVVPLPSTNALRAWIVPALGLVAAVVDFAAVVRRAAAIAGVPMLAVFTTCGAVAGKPVGWLPFTVCALGYLIVLSADSSVRLRTWGRLIRRQPGDHPGRTTFSLSGRRIGLIALVVAVVVPTVIPGLGRNLLTDAFHRSSGSGSDGATLSPFADLKGSLKQPTSVTVAQVHVSDGVNPFYLRSIVLDQFTSSGWRMQSGFSGQPISPDALSATAPVGGTTKKFTATITIDALKDVAPLFAFPSSLDGLNGRWRYNTTTATLGNATTRKGNTITEDVSQPNPSTAELVAATGDAGNGWLQLPSLPAVVTELVRRLTAGQGTEYEKARAMSDYFRNPANGFVYSLSTIAGDSGNDLVDFLDNKSGYCQQYAAALGVMFRAAGIPARVVLGYTHSPADRSGNFTVTSHDAHAWVEGYFAGIGWVPFDPTPLTGTDAGRAVALPYETQSATPTSGLQPSNEDTRGSGATASGASSASSSASSTAGAIATTSTPLLPRSVVVTALAVLAVLALLLVLPGLRWTGRRRRVQEALRTGRLEPLWGELYATALDTGTEWGTSTTPRQVPAWLADRGVVLPGAVDQLARGVERERYGRDETHDPQEITTSIERVTTVSRAMRARLGRWARLRARLIPTSLVRRR